MGGNCSCINKESTKNEDIDTNKFSEISNLL